MYLHLHQVSTKSAVTRDYIYISSDFGVTWTQSNSPQKYWQAVSLSASGQYQTAVSITDPGVGGDGGGPEYIYVSTDFGNTWTQSNSPEKKWFSVSLSDSGQYQTAVVYNGYIYISSDFGVTWTQSNNSLEKYWFSVSLSKTGKYQTAVAANDYIYVSSDFGNTWTQTNSLQKIWQSVSISATGQYQTAVAYNDYIYISSDFGVTWTLSNNSLQKNWFSVSITSSSGRYQTALVSGPEYIYVSTDFGNTWTETNSPEKIWRSASLSTTGQYQTAVAYNDYIYTCISSPTGP